MDVGEQRRVRPTSFSASIYPSIAGDVVLTPLFCCVLPDFSVLFRWEVYSAEVSRELELARRAGKSEHTLQVLSANLCYSFRVRILFPVLK